jgi:WD40 repeat protein/Flp pilus assembly protein TadD
VDVDSRSDIYSLGVLLYELLTGTTPFSAETFRTAGYDMIRRIIREQEPPRPSTRLSALGATSTTTAANRQTDPRRLWRSLRGELDWIVMKCLEKDRRRRYETPNGLAADLRHYLNHEPVEAGPPSAWYGLRKSARRNRAVLATATLVSTALVAVAVISVIYARAQARATTEIKALATDLGKERESLKKSLGESNRLLGESNRLLAIRNFERGRAACEQGEIGPGMLWMIESWRSAVDAGDPAWQHVARANLAAWRPHYPRLKAVLSHKIPAGGAFSPDSRTVISWSMDGTAQLWDAASGQKIGPSLRVGGQYLNAGFSPDGKTVWTSSEGGWQFWDATTGEPHALPLRLRPKDRILGVAIQPGGRIVLLVTDHDATNILRLQDGATGQLIAPPLKRPGGFSTAAFSPDGKTILTGSEDGTALLWDAASGQPLGLPMRHESRVRSVGFSPDGRMILIASQGGSMRLWDAATGQPIGRSLKRPGGFRCATFSPDGKTILTGSEDGTALLWDAASGQPLGPPMRHESQVRHVAFSPDGKIVLTGCQDKEARLWDAATGQLIGLLKHQGGIFSVAFSPDGKTILTGSHDGTVRLWDADPGQPVGQTIEIPSTNTFTSECGLSPDGNYLISLPREPDYHRYLKLWNATTRQPIAHIPQPDWNLAREFSPDGKVLLTIETDQTLVHSAAVQPRENGKVLLTIEAHQTARLWDGTTGAALGAAFPLPSPVLDTGHPLRFSPDGKALLFVGEDQRAWICDVATGSVRGRTPPLGRYAYALGFSPNGKTFFTGVANGEVQLWDAATATPLGDPIPNPGGISSGLFSHDGRSLLVTCEDGSGRLWDLATRTLLIPPLRHLGPLYGLAFSPDSKTIATGTQDKTARLWDVATGQPIGPILRHQGPVHFVAFHADGKILYTRDRNPFPWSSVSRLFPIPPDLPDELERVATWVEVITGLRLDRQQGLVQILDNAAWHQSRERLMQLGGPPQTGPDQRLDPILFGADPTARAKSFMERKQWDAAEAAFDEAMRARPFNLSVVVDRGDLYTRRGLWSEAPAYYARTVELYPDVALLHEQLAVTRLLAGDLPGYRAACAGMLEHFKPIDDSTAAVRVAYACSFAPRAVTDFPALVQVSARSNRWVASNERVVGAVLFRAGRLEEALQRFEQGHRAFEPRAWDWLLLAMIHSGLGHSSEARRLLQQAEQWIAEADKAPSGTQKEGPSWSSVTERPTIVLLRREAEALLSAEANFPADPFAPHW